MREDARSERQKAASDQWALDVRSGVRVNSASQLRLVFFGIIQFSFAYLVFSPLDPQRSCVILFFSEKYCR